MIEAFVAVLVVVAGAAYWLMARRARAANPVPRPTKAGGRFGAVEIRTRRDACDSARALEGQRFLSKDAPALPLRDCTTAQCACRFTKLSDRRTDGRRLELGGLATSLFVAATGARSAIADARARSAVASRGPSHSTGGTGKPRACMSSRRCAAASGITDERDAVEPDAIGDAQRRPAAAVDDAFEVRAALDEKIDRARSSRRDT